MSLQSSLYAFLSADAGIGALVSNRIFPLIIPDQEFDEASKRPCLVYSIAAMDQTKTFCGTIDLRRATVSSDCYARKYVDAVGLSTVVKDALADYVGTMGDVEVSAVSLENQFDLVDLEPGLFRVALSFFVWHAE